MIAWTDALRALVVPTRAEPNPAYLAKYLASASATESLADVAAAHAELRDWDHWAHEKQLSRIRAGWAKTEPALLPLVKRALEEQARRTPPPGPLDSDVEAVLVALELGDTWGGVPFWYAKEGLAFALRTLVRVHQFLPSNHAHGYGSSFWVEESWDAAHRVDASTAWNILRGLVTRASEAEYAAARSAAAELRAKVPLVVRALLSFAFPDERAWNAEDVAAVLADPKAFWGDPRKLAIDADVPAAEALARAKPGWVYGDEALATLLARGGDAAAPVLGALLDVAERNDERKTIAKMLALVATPEAAAIFGPWLTNKAIAPIATKYFKAHPELAQTALAPVAGGRSKQAGAAALALEASGNAKAGAPVDVAAASALPEILARPPWRSGKAPKGIALQPIVVAPQIAFAPGVAEAHAEERAEWEREREGGEWKKDCGTDDELVRWVGSRYQMPMFWLARVRDTKLALALWEEKPAWYWTGPERALPDILAAHGEAAIPVLLRWAEGRIADAITGLVLVVAPEVAPILAEARLRTKSVRGECDRWLLAHPEVAALGLIPAALGPAGAKRTAAETALLLLRDKGHGGAVLDVAGRYGAEAKSAIAALDARNAFPAKLPKLPDFAKASALPAVMLTSGGALPEEAVRELLTMLAFDDAEAPYVGIDEVRASCTQESLREFVWALFERWLSAAAPAKESWALGALGTFGDDELVRRLVPKLRAWPKEKAIARAQAGLGVLGRIGTELALVHVDAIAQSFPFASMKEKAAAVIDEIGHRRGLSKDELADRLAPTLGLDEHGTRVLEFGARAFRVGFDEHLVPFVRSGEGKLLSELPKANKSDVAAKAKEAHAAWKALKADAKALGARQIARLERAMVAERTWSVDEFDRFLRRHPLLRHVAARLVWRARAEATEVSFRIAEDGSLAGIDDGAIALSAEARVSVIHPVTMGERERTRWQERFADYELLQPFPQLARAVFPEGMRSEDALAKAGALDHGKLRALRESGYRSDGESAVSYLVKDVVTARGEPALVIVGLEPGFTLGTGDVPPQKVTKVELELRAAGKEADLDALAPITRSELFRDLSA